MQRFMESAFYAAVFTISGFGLYYPIGFFMTVAQKGDTTKFFLDSLVGSFIAFIFFLFVCWEITGAFERLNQRGRKNDRHEDETHDGSKDKDGPESKS